MWEELTENQKIKFKEYCDSKYRKTHMFCETGEPLYMNEKMELIDTTIVIILLFNNDLN
jgi:hypothetical protein